MRRNILRFTNLLCLIGVTIVFTVICYKSLRKFQDRYNPNLPTNSKDIFKQEQPHFNSFIYNEKIDWHNYNLIQNDGQRKGKGEQGKPAELLSNERQDYDKLYKVNGFNAALSDKIALDRSLPDLRHVDCKKKKYLKHLGTVSVIVPFYNEHISTLLRTATSVIKQSPDELLKEIILVDDHSTKLFLKKQLDDTIRANMSKVQVLRLPKRSGLIIARQAGARIATGDVLIFLDSHTEATVNWLPPLLEPIAQDHRTCVCPFIDVVDYETFEYRMQDNGARGAFDWEFYYKRLPLQPQDLEHPAEPFKSPIMAGGLFAIHKDFFWELGGYDEGLDIWGGEQYELSFKIWMCGGRMYDAPCSRVGHIYRKFAPFSNPRGGQDFLNKNFKRVAVVWMDEYAEYLYKRKPRLREIVEGDVSKQIALRQKLKCNSFNWFMQEIAFDLTMYYPLIEPDDFGYGEIRNMGAPEFCVDTSFKVRDGIAGIEKCIKDISDHDRKAGEQSFQLTWHKDIRPQGRSLCLDVPTAGDKANITMFPCHGHKGNQLWRYDPHEQTLIHGGNPRCLDCDPATLRLYVTTCDGRSKTQKWRVEHVNLTMIENWAHIGIPD